MCYKLKIAGSIPDEVNECFPIYIFIPAALDHRVYSASSRNEYQKQEKKYFWGVEHGRRVRFTT
jgi:hypothetical protein